MTKIEIMAPAGSYETLHAAIKAGADSVYFGIGKLNMRSASSVNFTMQDLKEIVSICKKAKVKTYLTLNTVMYNEDIEEIKSVLDSAKKEGINAVITCDFAVINYANKIKLPVHISTQANVSNIEAVRFFSKFAETIVLARELSLEQITNICNQIKKENIKGPNKKPVEIEVFIHGALCVSISGKCYMSLALYNKSANRGECLQVCRRGYKVTDDETGNELRIKNKYVMSPSDLCTIGFLDKIIGAGVKVLKIEGRGRKADYVYHTVKAYKEAVESIDKKTYTKEKISNWIKELESVYNRGFWHGGYYMGKKINEWTNHSGSKATLQKIQIGKALNYYIKPKIGLFQIESGELKVGNNIMITGPTTGIIEAEVTGIQIEDNNKKTAKKGDRVTIPLSQKIRENDKLFLVVKQ